MKVGFLGSTFEESAFGESVSADVCSSDPRSLSALVPLAGLGIDTGSVAHYVNIECSPASIITEESPISAMAGCCLL